MGARIYTKVGDGGQSSLVGGQKVSKADARLEAYGTIDELNSVVGFARAALRGGGGGSGGAVGSTSGTGVPVAFKDLDQDLMTVQHWLFDLGSLLAATPEDRAKYKLRSLTSAHVNWLEKKIDAATTQLAPLKNFILPAGHEASCRLHLARTVARRAERLLASSELETHLPDQGLVFINRISDYFFVMARLVNHVAGEAEVLWQETAT